MSYFCAHLELVCIVDEEFSDKDSHLYLCDNQFFILVAGDKGDALAKAKEIGFHKEHSYKNSDGETVCWRFRGVPNIWQLPELLDGIEVASFRDWRQSEVQLKIDMDLEPEKLLTQYSDERHQANRMHQDNVE